MSIKFKRIIISPENGVFDNISYLPQVLSLVNTYKHCLFDDYFYEDSTSVSDSLISLIIRTAPYFWVITSYNDEFRGFVYLDDWQGSCATKHSATVTTCIDPRFWGKFTRFAGKRFIKYIFKRYKIRKLKAEVYSDNKNAVSLLKRLGFKKECRLLSETIVASKPTDIDIYSIIKQ